MSEELIAAKAHAYDLIVRLEATQAELRATNDRIAQLTQETTDGND